MTRNPAECSLCAPAEIELKFANVVEMNTEEEADTASSSTTIPATSADNIFVVHPQQVIN